MSLIVLSDKIREELMKILLEDPTSFETRYLAEGFLVECLEKVIQNPTENVILPFIEKHITIFQNKIDDIERRIGLLEIENENKINNFVRPNIDSIRNEIYILNEELMELKKIVYENQQSQEN